MRRRELLLAVGGASFSARESRAQQKTIPVIGVLLAGSRSPYFSIAPDPLSEDPIRQGLREIGYVDGKNVAFEYRWDDGNNDRLPELAADLVSRNVDLIITRSGTAGALAAKSATSTIPIVFVNVGDPVAAGLVASLGRPGGNLTGFSSTCDRADAQAARPAFRIGSPRRCLRLAGQSDQSEYRPRNPEECGKRPARRG